MLFFQDLVLSHSDLENEPLASFEAFVARMKLGSDETIPLICKKGRAVRLGERAIGHRDPGSESAWMLMNVYLEQLRKNSLIERIDIMKIAFGCDPNASEMKKALIEVAESLGHEVKDFGSDDPIYANTAIDVANAVVSKEYDRGVVVCGTGIGVSISANKVKGAYCALRCLPARARTMRTWSH